MKQHITKEQWDELSDGEQKTFWGEEYHHNDPNIFRNDLPDIGQLIEFLGADWTYIRNNIHTIEVNTINNFFKSPELVDALCKSVKYKLKSE